MAMKNIFETFNLFTVDIDIQPSDNLVQTVERVIYPQQSPLWPL